MAIFPHYNIGYEDHKPEKKSGGLRSRFGATVSYIIPFIYSQCIYTKTKNYIGLWVQKRINENIYFVIYNVYYNKITIN